ncbi:MAG: LLM class flavin-dependent oxidoreductase [Alphaproteobacteria bacterium]|nr:LLM class flavin-dependent oxidoreductase [Alphaproteobacteria bacterium]
MPIRPRQRDRNESNPAFGARRLKLGTFQTNLDSGCVMSDLDGRLDITWPNTVALAKLADEMEFEALVPVARWTGFGGATNPQGPGFETYTWAAGIAGATTNAGVISTSHVALTHPIVAAKQSAAIDHISGGRYTLNIVNGWNYPEMEMFGVSLLGHADRYACAEEWLAIVKRLWTEDETFDHEGRFYKIKKGYLAPKPIQHPYPAIMNAGSSERGRHFACKHCDLVFTSIRTFDIDTNKAHVQAYRRLAREEYGREVRIWSNANIVQAETEQEARAFYNYYVNEKGDWAAANHVIETMAAEINERDYPPERRRAMAEMFVQGWGGFPLVGTKEQIVDGLKRLSSVGYDGLLLSFPRYEQGLREFRDVTYPLVVQAGLRDLV